MSDYEQHDRDAEEVGVVNLQRPQSVDWLARQRNRGDHPRDAARWQMRRDRLASFEQGAEVETPDGVGVVTDRFLQQTTFAGKDVQGSREDPAYAVALIDPPGAVGFGIYNESELSDGEIVIEGADPDDVTETELSTESGTLDDGDCHPDDARMDVTALDYPTSWEESPTPTRTILLKAWAGMNGQFDRGDGCCIGEVGDNADNPAALCAAMKDRVMLTEDWRQ